MRCLRENEEGSPQVGADDLVEGFDVAFGDGRERHDGCVVDDNADLAEGLDCLLEELLDVFGVCDVGLDGESTAACISDLIHHFFGIACVARVVDAAAESVSSEAKSDGTSDAPGCVRNDSCLSHGDSPFWRLLRQVAFATIYTGGFNGF